MQLQKKYIRTERDGIRAIKFEAARIHFLCGVFVAVAVALVIIIIIIIIMVFID